MFVTQVVCQSQQRRHARRRMAHCSLRKFEIMNVSGSGRVDLTTGCAAHRDRKMAGRSFSNCTVQGPMKVAKSSLLMRSNVSSDSVLCSILSE